MKYAPRPVTPAPGDVPAALHELGISFRVVDDEAEFLCPYHNDRRVGSFSVNIETGKNSCFSCGEGGPFVRVVEVVLGVSHDVADRWCRARRMKSLGGSPLVSQGVSEPRKRSGAVNTLKQVNEASLALFTDPPDFALAGTDRWVGCSLDAARHYGVLWNPETASWIIPIRDAESHDLIGWQEKGSGDSRYFKNTPRGVDKSSTLLGLESLENCTSHARTFVLVESPLDVLRLYTAGVRGGVSGYGVRVSDRQLRALIEASSAAPRLVLALDNDSAGSGETLRLVRSFKRVRVLVFNYGRSRAKDPGAMTDGEVRWGIDNAISGLLWRP